MLIPDFWTINGILEEGIWKKTLPKSKCQLKRDHFKKKIIFQGSSFRGELLIFGWSSPSYVLPILNQLLDWKPWQRDSRKKYFATVVSESRNPNPESEMGFVFLLFREFNKASGNLVWELPETFETQHVTLSVRVTWSLFHDRGTSGFEPVTFFGYSYGWTSGSTVDLIIFFVISRTHGAASTYPSAIEDSWLE